ncbi:MAG: HAMP domain-containing sensor histidine kinase [Pseudomonadota bacterium]
MAEPSLDAITDELGVVGVAWVSRDSRVMATRGALARWLTVGDLLAEGATVLNGLDDEFDALADDPERRLTLQDITFGEFEQHRFHTIVVRWHPGEGCFLVVTTAVEASESSLASVTQLSRARRYYEDALEREREHFRSIYEHSPVFAFSCRERGQLVAATQDMRTEFLAIDNSVELSQVSVAENAFLTHFAVTDIWREVWSGTRVERRPWRSSTARGDVRDFEVSGRVTRHPTLDCLEGYFTLFDVTDLHATQDRLRRSNKRFESTARQVAHDLLSPLRRIHKLSELVASEFSNTGSEALRSTLDELLKSAQQGRNLVTDIVEVARTTAMRSSAVPIRPVDIMRNIEDEYAFDLEEIGAVVSYEGDAVEVQGDETLMMQIYRNFLSNAIKYRQPDRPLQVTHRTQVDEAAGLQIWFCDNGRGFDSAAASDVFEAYVRLVGKDDVHGTGIGLDIVKEAVDLLGWSVHAMAQPGEGASFVLTLGRSHWRVVD